MTSIKKKYQTPRLEIVSTNFEVHILAGSYGDGGHGGDGSGGEGGGGVHNTEPEPDAAKSNRVGSSASFWLDDHLSAAPLDGGFSNSLK